MKRWLALEADQPRDTTNQKEAGAIIKVMSRIINNNKQKLKGDKASKGILRSTTKHTGDAGTVDSWCRSRVLYCCWYHSLDHMVFGTASGVARKKNPLVTIAIFSFCVECEEVLRVARNDIKTNFKKVQIKPSNALISIETSVNNPNTIEQLLASQKTSIKAIPSVPFSA